MVPGYLEVLLVLPLHWDQHHQAALAVQRNPGLHSDRLVRPAPEDLRFLLVLPDHWGPVDLEDPGVRVVHSVLADH